MAKREPYQLCEWEECNSNHIVERHHIFGGANRKKSEKYKLTIYLCFEHHRHTITGVHSDGELMLKMHQYGQRKFMEEQGKTADEFRNIFGRNYL